MTGRLAVREVEATGTTVEGAIREALRRIGLPRERVEIHILSEGRAGLFGLQGAEPARVRVAERPADGITPKEVEEARAFCALLLDKMGVPARVAAGAHEGVLGISIQTRDGGLLIGKNGETLEALQEVLKRWVNRDRLPGVKVMVDVEGYRLKQQAKLVTLAQKAAEKVKARGRAVSLNPMPASQRRIIHLALAQDPEVETSSEGEGRSRKVVIRPKA